MPSQASKAKPELFGSAKALGPLIFLLALAGAALYANSLRCSFQFDDGRMIVENTLTHNPFDLQAIWSSDRPRFITNFTFAINYFFSKDNVLDYHVTNVLLHIGNSILLFLCVWLTAQTPLLRHKLAAPQARDIAFFSSMIFLCHPLQTQAVTYIVQRATSLATFFYLGTIVCYAKARLTENSKWYAGACVACFLAMFTKQISFTLPFMILLYDVTCFGAEDRGKKQRLLGYLPFFLTLWVIPLITLTNPQNTEVQLSGLPAVTGGVSRPEYLMTQLNVLRTYLRLFFFPLQQNFVYDYPIAQSFSEPQTLASFFLLSGILLVALMIFRKYRLIAFGIFWFFITLSVESSVIPIPHVIFEHRLYLPIAGFSIAVCSAAYGLLRHPGLFRGVMVLCLIALSFLTIQRNKVWESKFSLWQDTVKKSPNSASSRYSLGLSLAELGRHREAIEEYQRSMAMGYEHPRMQNDLARAYEALGDLPNAIAHYEKGIKADPKFVPAYSNLGTIFARLKMFDQALAVTRQAADLDPANAMIVGNLGAIYASMGHFEEAVETLELALRIDPAYEPARKNLAKIREKMRAKNEGPENAPGNG